MKKIIFLILLSPLNLLSQEQDYQLNSFTTMDLNPSKKAPNTHYIGSAWLKSLVRADQDFEYNLTLATFAADSTLDWHKHSTGQVLIIVEGEGYYQERGKEVVILKKGTVVKCNQNVEHWHSSTPNQLVSYIAIYGASETVWTEKLSKETYDKIQIN